MSLRLIPQQKLLNILNNNRHLFILTFFVCIYILYFTTASFLRYENFYTGRFDLGHMTQTVWNTANGKFFEMSNSGGSGIISRLAAHADFILILFAPLYFIWDDPRMLLLILTITLALGAYFVFKIAENVLENKNISLILSIVYLFYPALQYNNLYDFHAVSLATTFLLGAFYFLIKNKYFWVTIFLILAALTKEQVWLVTAFFGGYIFLKNKDLSKKILGIAFFLLSVLTFYYLIWHAIPQSRGGNHFALEYYSEFGDSPTQIVTNFILSPQKIFTAITSDTRLDYLRQIFSPLGFLSIFAPFYLIFALPDFAINLLSNNPQLHQIYYQYSSNITPFIFISAIFGIKNLTRWFSKIPKAIFSLYIILTLAISCYSFGPLPFSKHPNNAMFLYPLRNKDTIENFIEDIPINYSVSSTNELGSHLSHRREIYNVPANIDKVDLVLFLVNDTFYENYQLSQKEVIQKLRNDKNYEEIFTIENFIAFRKKR